MRRSDAGATHRHDGCSNGARCHRRNTPTKTNQRNQEKIRTIMAGYYTNLKHQRKLHANQYKSSVHHFSAMARQLFIFFGQLEFHQHGSCQYDWFEMHRGE